MAAPGGIGLLALLLLPHLALAAPSDELRDRADQGVRSALQYLVGDLVWHGGYPSRFRPASAQRFGAGELSVNQIAVGPDGTAAVGLLLLEAHRTLGDVRYRDAARDAARALAAGQLATGGWTATVDTAAPAGYTRRQQALSVAPPPAPAASLLAPGITPEALRLVLAAAAETGDAALAESAAYGLRTLLNGQLAGGGWPAALPLPADEGRFADLAATAAVVRLLLEAEEAEPAALPAAARGAEFLVLAALPGGAGWPARAEVAGRPLGPADPGATAAAVSALLRAQETTGDAALLAPLRSLTDLPAPLAEAVRQRLRSPGLPPRPPTREQRARLTAERAEPVAAALAALDEQGRWLDDGEVRIGATLTRLRLLLTYLREYEPLPELPPPGSEGAPQHRRM